MKSIGLLLPLEVKREGEIKKARAQKVRSPKATLWLYCFEKCRRDWGGKKPLTRPYFAMKTNHLKTDADWFFIKSLCEQEERRGVPFAKTFWGALKIQPWQCT